MSDLSPNGVSYREATQAFDYWNLAMSYSQQTIPVAGTHEIHFELCPTPDDAKLAFLIENANGAQLIAVLRSFPFKEKLGIDLDLEIIGSLDTDVSSAILTGSFQQIHQELPLDLQVLQIVGELQPLKSLLTQKNPDQLSWVNIKFGETGKAPFSVALGLNPCELTSLLDGLPLTRQAAWAGLRQEVTINTSLCLTAETLPLNQVRGLEVNDLILLEATSVGNRIMVETKFSRHHLVLVEQGWGCEKVEKLNPMSEEAQSTATEIVAQETSAQTPQVDLSNMVVPITLEIGEREMTVAELESWQAGTLIDVELPAVTQDLAITLRAGSKRIAIGNLVEIDNRKALRIERLLPDATL